MIYAFALWLAGIFVWAYLPGIYYRWRLMQRWRRLQSKIDRIQSRIHR
jgi:hypothetical protein